MTLEQARNVLGLGPTDCPSGHMDELVEAREQLATMVRDAPNDTIALRYQDSLQEFDRQRYDTTHVRTRALQSTQEQRASRKIGCLVRLPTGHCGL